MKQIKKDLMNMKIIKHSLWFIVVILGVKQFGVSAGIYVGIASLVVANLPMLYLGMITKDASLTINRKGKNDNE